METLTVSERRYGMRIHRVKYENVINAFKPEINSLLNYLGLEWEDQLQDYRSTAIKRGRIDTPSYSQVIRPLYNDSINRWKHYENYLRPYYEKIQPWATALGYEI